MIKYDDLLVILPHLRQCQLSSVALDWHHFITENVLNFNDEFLMMMILKPMEVIHVEQNDLVGKEITELCVCVCVSLSLSRSLGLLVSLSLGLSLDLFVSNSCTLLYLLRMRI